MKLSIAKDVIFRSVALFLTMALPAIGAGAFAGVEPVKSALIAGALGVSLLFLKELILLLSLMVLSLTPTGAKPTVFIWFKKLYKMVKSLG